MRYISRRMRESDYKSIFLSVLGLYVVRTSSLIDKHSFQLFRKAASFSSIVLLSSSLSTAKLSCLLATTFFSLRFLFNFAALQSFVSGQALFLVVIGHAKRAPHWGVQSRFCVIGERVKRARHSLVCSIENRGYIIESERA